MRALTKILVVLLLLTILFFNVTAMGATEKECLSNMTKDSGVSEEKTAVMLMQCSTLFMKGQFGFLQQSTKAHLSFGSKADSLLEYAACEEMTFIFKSYMNHCMNP